ncbi:30S ribosomal protein S4 [Pseudomonadota bacterium]
MARYTGPKYKLMRKVSTDLGLSTNPVKVAKRLNILPGFHGRKGRRKISDFGIQLLEKQKVRILYGVLEKQFRKYFDKAAKNPTATGAALLTQLEQRLDNTIYRLGMSPTRTSARQLVTHGNVRVNNQKVSIPSYSVKTNDVITLTSKAIKIPYIAEQLKNKNVGIPKWLKRKAAAGQVIRPPEREDITEDINEQLIVEYYSR